MNNYYRLPLKRRFAAYQTISHKASGQRRRVLRGLYDRDGKEQRLTALELTKELKEIMPAFEGTVLRRDYNAWPSYVIGSADMKKLFNDSVFGEVSGKVITSIDSLLSPRHQDLAGQLILIAAQESEEKEGLIASHEGYHRDYCNYPNAQRRDHYQRLLQKRLQNQDYSSLEDQVTTLIRLDQAIQIDEAGAVLSSYDWLETGIWKPWKPGRDGEKYNSSLIQAWYGQFAVNFTDELKNSCRNMFGFSLSSIRAKKGVGSILKDNINQHECDSLIFPQRVQQTITKMSQKLQNPENLEPLSYAMTYMMEALQIVDFQEILDGTLESFCVNVLEPHRLKSWKGLTPAFAQMLTRSLN